MNDEKRRMILDALLTEYKEMKNESNLKLQVQITLISLYVTAFGVLLTLIIDKNLLNDMPLLLPYFLCIILPGVMICIAIIWLDQVYRQTKIAVYISFIEKKINLLLDYENNIMSSVLFAEQWFRKNITAKKNINISQTFYYICLGIFICFPLVSCSSIILIFKYPISEFFKHLIVFAFCYIVFIFFVFLYIIEIRKLNKLVYYEIISNNLFP